MKKNLFLLLFWGIFYPVLTNAQSSKIITYSPDHSVLLQISSADDGNITYSISHKTREVIKPSRLGFSLNKPRVELNSFSLISADSSLVDNSWEPVLGEVAIIRNHYRELKIRLKDRHSEIVMSVVFRVFNEGVGFRYEFPEQPSLNHFVIAEENTQFVLAGDHKTFWIPGDYDSNEYLYNTTKLSEIDALAAAAKEKDIALTSLIGTSAVQTPLMMKSDDGLYINIHEAALVNYSTLNLVLDKTSLTFQTHLVPDAIDNKGYLQTPAKTPWRTIIVSDHAADILASKLILNLNEPSKIADTDWIYPQKFIGVWWEMHIGKGTWDKASGKHAAYTENVKKYIDFAAKYGFDGVLVEGWNQGWEDWFGNWKEEVFDFVSPYSDYDINQLTAYAKTKGVKIIMHHETSGSVTNYERRMETAFQYMIDHGMNTVKTGYVGKIIPRGEHHDGQWMNNHYIRVAETAARYKIMVEAHEPSHPTGLHRTYPNWIANEAARGNEFNNAPTLGITPEHQTILPFTRLMGGPMDFTPGLFHFKLNQFDSTRTTEVRTTLAKQLALYVTMYSPLQMAGDLPENYEKHPDALQFIVDVPVDWDDTKILEAEPGDYITIARKEKGKNNWFVGGITDEHARTTTLRLDFLDKKKEYNAIIYRDGEDAHWETRPESYLIEKQKVRSSDKLTLHLAEGGGFAISLVEE
ncbi:MAG: glycoside hydrolase family 97 protein [Bacteroidia bacterium]|nr:glycoside hydrolase family 97 protein [Bacteroidia bacterium]